MAEQLTVVFICMGNICRSPLAHAVFSQLVQQQGLQERITVDSAGTHANHTGKKPDIRAIKVARVNGYEVNKLRSKKITQKLMRQADYVLAIDQQNISDLQLAFGEPETNKIDLLLNYHSLLSGENVPDPYYRDYAAFENVLAMVENAALGLLQHIRHSHQV